MRKAPLLLSERTAKARPVRMKPICDIDEQASVRLRLTLKRARTAPNTIVITAKTNRRMPNAELS